MPELENYHLPTVILKNSVILKDLILNMKRELTLTTTGIKDSTLIQT